MQNFLQKCKNKSLQGGFEPWSKKTQGEHTNHLATRELLMGYVVD